MLDHPVASTSVFSKPTAPLHLIIFTRYPEPGKTKTRLIPALGPSGAAIVQRQMTEWALGQAQQLLRSCSSGVFKRFSESSALSIDIRFAGGTTSSMEAWLGSDWTYLEQGDGNLGDRLIRAFQSAFERGAKAVIVIGIDCPGVTSQVLTQAFERLLNSDGVIGPADDGGYYLIGLRQPTPDLFRSIEWGTETVRSSTLAIAEQLGLTLTQLNPLSDVDRPEDLVVWQQISAQAPPQITERISIVIPVLNEAEHIQKTIRTIQRDETQNKADAVLEIIVVDGGSSDDTVAYAKEMGVNVISSSPGRALQMNAGAAIATGEYILFLHADTQLPADFSRHIRQTLSQPHTVAGAFELSIQGTDWGLRLIEFGVKWRSRLGQMPYGDQAIFIKADLFRNVGGFPRLPIMEDFEFIRQIKRRGQVKIAKAVVVTSGRRWQRLGLLKTTLVNQAVIVGYALGIPIEKLARWYRHRP